MRTRLVALPFYLAVCLGSVCALRAQFPAPSKEELQMTSDPKAPGAAAVILYREERTDDMLHYHAIVERIKVLTEKGKEAATIHVPYEQELDKGHRHPGAHRSCGRNRVFRSRPSRPI